MSRPTTVTIAASAALASALYVGPGRLVSIQMPAAWTTANLTFQGSADGTTYTDIYDKAGTELSVTAAASQMLLLQTLLAQGGLDGALWLKIRSGTTGSPVNQGAARSLICTVQKFATI